MDSTVKGGKTNGEYGFIMDVQIDNLRKEIWKTIHIHKKSLPYADIGMALGIVQYELLHHSDEKAKR